MRAAVHYLLLLWLALAWAAPAEASLAKSDFADLVAESELIAVVKVVEVQLDRYGSGHVVIELADVLRGKVSAKRIRIGYDDEVHDQRMAKRGEKRLVFLKKKAGTWTGAHYGRSYWPLKRFKDKKVLWLAAPFIYPMTMLRFGKEHKGLFVRSREIGRQIKNVNEAWEGKKSSILPVSLLRKFLQRPGKPAP